MKQKTEGLKMYETEKKKKTNNDENTAKYCPCSSPAKHVRGKEDAAVEKRPCMTSHLEFAQRHVGDFKVNWKKVLWFDGTEVEVLGHATLGGHRTLHVTTDASSPP